MCLSWNNNCHKKNIKCPKYTSEQVALRPPSSPQDSLIILTPIVLKTVWIKCIYMETEPAGRTVWNNLATAHFRCTACLDSNYRVSVYGLVLVCTVSVWRVGLAVQIKLEASPLRRAVWVEGRATAEATFQTKARFLWGVKVSITFLWKETQNANAFLTFFFSFFFFLLSSL